MNIVLAILVFALVLMLVGEEISPPARIGEVRPDTPAAVLGLLPDDEIRAVNGVPVTDWRELGAELDRVPGGGDLTLEIERAGQAVVLATSVPADSGFASALLGVAPFAEPVVGYVRRNGPAWNAGLRRGDHLTSVGGVAVDRWTAMRTRFIESPGEELTVTWERDGHPLESRLVPDVFVFTGEGGEPDTIGQVGIQQAQPHRQLGPVAALVGGWERTWFIAEQILGYLPSVPMRIYRGLVKGEEPGGLGGPVRLAQLSGEAALWGLETFLGLLAAISANLAIFNLLPIPVLDGGHLVLHGVEAVMRRSPPLKVRLVLHQIGFGLLMLLVLSVTILDIGRLFG
jgi:regulator of sigma E protease